MAVLKLVEDGNVVQLPVKEPSTFDEAWSCREGAMRTRGLGMELTRKLWNKKAAKAGHRVMLEALKRNLREKPEKDGYTHCGLSVWLNQERWELWPCQSDRLSNVPSQSLYEGRNHLISALGEPFVRSYLDPCTFHEDGFITPATEYAMRKLVEQKGALKQAGIIGIRKKGVD